MQEILVVDDDTSMRSTLSLLVERAGHRATCSPTLSEAMGLLASKDFDVVFLDVRLPDGNGLEVLPRIEGPEVIIITGFGDPSGAELAIRSGAWDYIEKDSSAKEIRLALDRALQYRLEKRAGGRFEEPPLRREGIVGESPKLKACLDLVGQAAGGEANVLITGETGTGKELFAAAIHGNSLRAQGDFVVVDCAALPDTLVEALLFGHEKGTFTGAQQHREGLIRQADGGTLFLDEVGELPLSLQKAFLRVLQEHRFRPLGSSREISSDFRLVAATNRDLDEMVAQGQFRSDLLFRLRSFLIDLPPLRERREDIGELSRHLADRLCRRYGLPPKNFSPDFTETLLAYRWPGNVRELNQTLERAVASARQEPTLFPKHLPTGIRVRVAQDALDHEGPPDEVSPGGGLPSLHQFRDRIYAQAERQYLRDLTANCGKDIGEACRISGLSRSRLYTLLKIHGISRPK